METSAKNSVNVNNLFDELARKMISNNQGMKKTVSRPPGIGINQNPEP